MNELQTQSIPPEVREERGYRLNMIFSQSKRPVNFFQCSILIIILIIRRFMWLRMDNWSVSPSIPPLSLSNPPFRSKRTSLQDSSILHFSRSTQHIHLILHSTVTFFFLTSPNISLQYLLCFSSDNRCQSTRTFIGTGISRNAILIIRFRTHSTLWQVKKSILLVQWSRSEWNWMWNWWRSIPFPFHRIPIIPFRWSDLSIPSIVLSIEFRQIDSDLIVLKDDVDSNGKVRKNEREREMKRVHSLAVETEGWLTSMEWSDSHGRG